MKRLSKRFYKYFTIRTIMVALFHSKDIRERFFLCHVECLVWWKIFGDYQIIKQGLGITDRIVKNTATKSALKSKESVLKRF